MNVSRIDAIEELRLRRWAREHYVPASERPDHWHPLILNEMLTRGGPRLIESICKLLNILWDCELISPDWKQLLIAPVYKKGSPIDPDNYRPIALLSNIFKLYERVIDVRIRAVISFQLEQCGFQPGFGTPQQLLRMTILHKSVKAAGQELRIALIDLEKAFERVWRVGLLHQLWVLWY